MMIAMIAMDLMLVILGGVFVRDFLTIITQGKVHPIPNIPVLVMYTIVALVATGWGWRHIGVGKIRQSITGITLFAAGMTLLSTHVVLPWMCWISGFPVSTYTGYETVHIALGELIFFGLFGMWGVISLGLDIHRLLRSLGRSGKT